jgi:cyclopropane fatty-acyl-phospholipid synthase-like methyltransferase
MATIMILAAVAVAVWLVFFVFFPLGRGAIYDPSSFEETRVMADMAELVPGETAADLGSGDGRVVIALAQRGAEAHGYEVNPFLVALSRSRIRANGLQGRAYIHWGSFWGRKLSRYDAITVFQVGFVMSRLEAKLKRELAPGSRIVSHYWKFPTLRPERVQGNVYRYRVG